MRSARSILELVDETLSMALDLKTPNFDYMRKRLRTDYVYRAINPARYLLDWALTKTLRRGGSATTDRDRVTKVLLISDAGAATSEEQFNPFSFYRTELRDKLKLIAVHLLLDDVLQSPKRFLKYFDIVILKISFRTTAQEALNIVRSIKASLDGRRLIYFDGDDDLCVQWPKILPYVDLYVKKHLFRDRGQYLKRFVGKSNLTDYVYSHYNYSFSDDPIASETEPLPIEQLSKLAVGCNLASDRNIFKLYMDRRLRPIEGPKDYDIVFRGSLPNDWMYYLRGDIGPALERLGKRFRIITPVDRVPTDEYYREMQASKICISPFGYGEICWRDFEAMLSGCLVIKPDMGHVETNPDIFKPYQTYVPVQWDFSDLEEKCTHYLEHEDERRCIVNQAFAILDEFYRNDGIITTISNLVHRA